MHRNAAAPTEIGTAPWTRADMLRCLEEFARLYERRPIRDNTGGMLAPQMFLTWFALQTLLPSVVIESGVWKGCGTWVIEQACPRATLHCIDLDLSRVEYRSSRASYHKKDFSTLHLGQLPPDTVAFFDDHQNAYNRCIQARRFGIRHLLFEDNYPPSQGDCYSLKKAFASNSVDAKELRENLDIYAELPPVFKTERTRWGDAWDNYPTPDPLLTSVDHEYQQIYLDEAKNYTWLCYARLRPQAGALSD